MKKIVVTLLIGLLLLSGVSQAKMGSFQAGGVFGFFNGEGVDTTYGGPVVHYGLLDQLDLAGRYEVGSYSGVTMSFLTIGLNYYFRGVAKAAVPYVTAGVSEIWANFPGWADSTTGFFAGGGLNYRLNEQFIFNFDARAHQANYASFVLNAYTLSLGLMMDM